MDAKSILITGCSSGIGLCAAITLKKRGYRVFASARKMADVEKLKAQGLESILLDVDDSASIQRALDEILHLTGGTLDALFNNSGYVLPGAIEDLTRDLERAQFETNVFGAMELTQRVLPVMRKQGYGRIIQNSSIFGIVTISYCGAYNASKFALEGFTNTLRQELRGTPIHVSLINPGPITSKLRNHAHQYYQASIKKAEASLHRNEYQKMEQNYFNPSKPEVMLTLGPEAVVKKLIHALENPRPKAHYYIGIYAHTMAILRRILPDFALDWVLSKSRP